MKAVIVLDGHLPLLHNANDLLLPNRSNPLHLVERQRDSISLLSSLASGWKPDRVETTGSIHDSRLGRPNLSTHRTLRHFHSYATSHIDKQLTKLASMGGERERGASSGSNG